MATNIDKARILNALEDMESGFAMFDENDMLVFANKLALEHFPTMFAEMEKGANRRDATREQIRSQYPDIDEKELEQFSAHVYEGSFSGKVLSLTSESGRSLQTRYTILPDGLKVAFSHDVTENLKIERQLRHARRDALAASQAKSGFLASMSHEIRTPLNGVIGMAQALSHRDLPPVEREMVDTILESSRSLMTLLNDILDISKIEAGKLEISPIADDLRHKMARLERFYRPVAEEKGLVLKVVVDPSLPNVLEFDPVRVRQCVENIVSNALKFTSKGGVMVAVTRVGDTSKGIRLKVHVKDTGIGMTPEQQSKLFQNFSQADSSTTRQFGGSGLGLSIARKLARMMGGDVTCVSKYGEGSIFSFSFEAGIPESARQTGPQDQETGNSETSRAVGSLKQVRALVVDDNGINRRVARVFLEPLGMVVTEASDGMEALEFLEREQFDIVLLDVHMPIMDGPETFKRIRASGKDWSNIPVIALTADAMSGDREKYLAMGMDEYVSKPIEERNLITALSRLLGGKVDTSSQAGHNKVDEDLFADIPMNRVV